MDGDETDFQMRSMDAGRHDRHSARLSAFEEATSFIREKNPARIRAKSGAEWEKDKISNREAEGEQPCRRKILPQRSADP